MFNEATLEMIQDLVYPLVLTFTGFDAAGYVGEKSDLFIHVGEGLSDLSGLFILVGTALEDGRLTYSEIEAIIAKANELPEALDAIMSFFDADEVSE